VSTSQLCLSCGLIANHGFGDRGRVFSEILESYARRCFLAFAAAFIIEGLNRVAFLFLPRPNEGSLWIYLVRLFTYLLILAAILKKITTVTAKTRENHREARMLTRILRFHIAALENLPSRSCEYPGMWPVAQISNP